MNTPNDHQPTEAQCKAINAAADILETEANQLSDYLEKRLKTTFDSTGLAQDRVSIAIASEKRRLRSTAITLRSMLPQLITDEED